MAKTNAKMHNINLLNVDLIKTEISKGTMNNLDSITSQQCIDYVMSKKPGYKKQKLLNNKIDGVFLDFYYSGVCGIESSLAKFSKDFVEEGQNVLLDKGIVQSSVLFLTLNEKVYAVPTGQGFRVISNYIVDKFGLVALSSMDLSFKVTAINANNMSGKAHSENKVFRQELNFWDIQDLDTIIKELKGKINNKEMICQLLELPTDTKKNKLGVIAKDSLQLASSMKIEELIKVLKNIDKYITLDSVNNFVDIKYLDKNKNAQDIKTNNYIVYNEIVSNIENTDKTYLGYDFFNKDVDAFLDYDRYQLVYGRQFEEFDDSYDILTAIRNLYKKCDLKDKPLEEKIHFIQNVQVLGIDEDDKPVFFGKIIDNLSGEIKNDTKHYFMWYGSYYSVEEKYFNRLNKLIDKKLSIRNFDDTLPKWKENNEDEYNSKLAKVIDGALIHKCIPDNIEFADVLKFSDDCTQCNIYHAKDNFNCSMRELDRQIELSMKKLNELSEGNVSYFEELYKRSLNQKTRNDDNELCKRFRTMDEFIDTIKRIRKFVYKIVINVDNQESIIRSSSNIAKYCFNHILSLSNEYSYDMEICFVKP